MKLLYISSYHATLEYDDLKLFTEMGIDWFSTGLYLDPKNPNFTGSWSRPPIEVEVDDKLKSEFLTLNPFHKIYANITLTKRFVDNFDLVLCNFSFSNQNTLDRIWQDCKHKPVIFRTYSQQFPAFEYKLQQYKNQGLKLVRGSLRESTIANYAGEDAIIRCYVDQDKFKGWEGNDLSVLSFTNDFSVRVQHPNFNCYREYYKNIMPNLPCKLFGRDTEVAGGGGYISAHQQVEEYKNNRVYFNIGSPPASVTYNFLEAWMTGAPVITFGPKIGNGVGLSTHEPPHIIHSPVDGYYSDDIQEILEVAEILLASKETAKEMGDAGRKKCISLFGKDKVKKDWTEFFNSL